MQEEQILAILSLISLIGYIVTGNIYIGLAPFFLILIMMALGGI